MNTLLFLYGTLKRGCSNHGQMAGQKFIDLARTPPGFRLFDLGGYPAISAVADDRDGVFGEIWSVDPEGLERLDHFEGVHEGLYRRDSIRLMPPFADQPVFAYFPGLPVTGHRDLGSEWVERHRPTTP